MFCSIIIPTIGRATLARAVTSVLSQVFDPAEFEVVVVDDSGRPLSPATWQQSPQVQIVHNNRRERSFARNSGAAVARGHYLYFLDDDDWLLPGALAVFWQLAQQQPDAAWLHGGIQVVDENGRLLGETNSGVQGRCLAKIMGGAWVPIQSSLIRAEAFFRVGGYSPAIRGTEDQDLCRRIAAIAPFANTAMAVACLFRGADWQTSTDYSRAAEDTRLSRDSVVNQSGILRQMLASADNGYWRGRVVHVYLGLALWHMRRRRPFCAFSRAIHGLIAFLLSGRYVANRSFWQAMRDHHVPGSLHFIQIAWEQEARLAASPTTDSL
jgi:glycosyltransferase involved in cell wall biosynthesis